MRESGATGRHAAPAGNGTPRTLAPREGPGEPQRSVPELVRDLLRAVTALARGTARMAAFEARDVARRFGRRVALLVASAIVAAAGLIVVLAALALLAEHLLQLPRWAALAIVGVVALGAGAAGIAAAVKRLGHPDLAFPGTVAELSKDVDALTAPRHAR